MPLSNHLAVTIPQAPYAAMRSSLFTEDGNENFGVLFCGLSAVGGRRRLLGKEWWSAPDEAYAARLSYHLEITPKYLNAIVDHCLKTGFHPVIVHSHPTSRTARYSTSDDFGESRLLPVLAALVPGTHPASLLVAKDAVAGRHFDGSGFVPLAELTTSGAIESITWGTPSTTQRHITGAPEHTHDRQLRAFGVDGQRTLGRLRVAIVGAGGTGSAVAEQLVRAGVRDLLVIDPDTIEASNLARVLGSVPDDAGCGRYKVDVAIDHLRRIAPGVGVVGLRDTVIRQSVLQQLADRHLIFGCTDNHWSRATLNRFSHQHLIPVVDMGVRIDARGGLISAIGGQVSILGAGRACALCSRLVDRDLVRAESMPATERANLASEGYVQGQDGPVPSIISLNLVVSGLAVMSALSLFTGSGLSSPPAQLRYDGLRGLVFPVAIRREAGCDVCDPNSGVVGLGNAQVVSAYE